MGTLVQKDYGIQPNLREKDQSFVKFMGQTTWFHAMTQALQKHSEFMRPDLGPYDQMEYNFPDLPNQRPRDGVAEDINPGDLAPGDPLPPKIVDNECPCCYDVVWKKCDPNYWSGGRYPLVFNQEYKYHPATHYWSIEGDYNPDTIIHSPPCNQDMTYQCAQYHNFYFQYKLPSGGVGFTSYVTLCYHIAGVCVQCQEFSAKCLIVDCCQEEDYVAMTFDDASTSDTVAKNGSITLYVLNGCDPYNWTVSGTGFTLASSQTSTRQNTLTASNNDCGASQGSLATITVTDKCGTVVTFYIRFTGGQWAAEHWCSTGCLAGADPCGGCSSFSCMGGGPTCESYSPVGTSLYSLNKNRFRFSNSNMCVCTGTASWCDMNHAVNTTWAAAGHPAPTEYSTPEFGLGQMDCPNETHRCIMSGFWWGQWTC